MLWEDEASLLLCAWQERWLVHLAETEKCQNRAV